MDSEEILYKSKAILTGLRLNLLLLESSDFEDQYPDLLTPLINELQQVIDLINKLDCSTQKQ